MIRKEKLLNITAASLEKYLLFKNWKRDYNFKNKKLMVFEWEGESLVIPASEKYKDFYIFFKTEHGWHYLCKKAHIFRRRSRNAFALGERESDSLGARASRARALPAWPARSKQETGS